MGPDRSPSRLPLFDDLRVRVVYDFAHFRERVSAPVCNFLDLLIYFCSGPTEKPRDNFKVRGAADRQKLRQALNNGRTIT